MQCCWGFPAPLFLIVLLYFECVQSSFDLDKALTNNCSGCYQGACVNGSCHCLKGWAGSQCDVCSGRIKLTDNATYITDGPKNYSSRQKCTWIVENKMASKPVTMRLENFTTECGWDFLYIYDGNGIYGEQMAAFCGSLEPLEIAAPSGSALLYFVSDMAAHYQGFNISFEFDSCPYDCNGNGKCTASGCECNEGSTGRFCEIPLCYEKNENESGPCINGGKCKNGSCDCPSHYQGDHCQQLKRNGVWDSLLITGRRMTGRAAHASVMDNDDVIWTIGGEHFSGVSQEMIVTFNITTKIWTTIKVAEDSNTPESRYDHTVVKYKNKLYMFGGVLGEKNITNELWSFDMLARKWNVEWEQSDTLSTGPLAVVGHTAHVVGSKMIVFFGYNPLLGYVYQVQVYDFETGKWSFSGSRDHVNGRFGHSSVVVSDKYALIFGGTTGASNLTDSLMKFEFATGEWKYLSPSGLQLYLHSAVLLHNMVIVVGGNISGGQTNSNHCFNREVLAYDIECGTWDRLAEQSKPVALGRYGHSAVVADGKMYILGGFNGEMLDDVLRFTPADCGAFSKREICLNISDGVRCYFANQQCHKFDGQRTVKQDFISVVKNEPRTGGIECPNASTRQSVEMCEEQRDCVSCTSQNGCGWCPSGNQCLPSDQECLDAQMMLTTWEKCNAAATVAPRPCSMAHDCYSCKLLPHCNWYLDGRPTCITLEEEALLLSERRARELERLSSSLAPSRPVLGPIALPAGTNLSYCPLPCAEYGQCVDCMLHPSCMWCPSTERCINQDAYTLTFAYGQCKSWVNSSGQDNLYQKCQQESAECAAHKTCSECQGQPGCGWIDDMSQTGLGDCVKGTDSGPLNETLEITPQQWYFTTCPACQCNGHSKCVPGTGLEGARCESCADHTTSDHCQDCAAGFFGDARNGGLCQPCQCNGQASNCDNSTGHCYCTTKGVIGEHCEKCDQKYVGDPKNGKPCYYELAVDFIFTFKLKSDDRDRHANEIYLYSTPYKKDTDVTFQISCEGQHTALVALNLTSNVFEGHPGHTKQMMVHTQCDSKGLRRVYLASDPGFAFGTDANTTFYVRVSNFSTPITIQISFAQSPPINWVLFFVIFAACFIVLLVVAGLLWMIKLRIEVYRRNQNRINEIEHMASRPFSSVRLELTNPYTNLVANPISIEPCANYKAGVYTLAVRLPTGGRQTTPNGTSGLAVASALCLLTPAQLGVLTAPESTDNRNNRKRTLRSYIPFLRNS